MTKRILIFIVISQLVTQIFAINPFRFAFITDLHIQMENASPAQDLESVIRDINLQHNIDFVLVGGDITEFGDKPSLEKAKVLLSSLKMPFYIVPGNHDQKLSVPTYDYFNDVFGDNKFSFSHKGIHFVGFTTRPAKVGGNGVVAQEDIVWVEKELSALPDSARIIAVTHYPLQTGDVDNWRDMVDVLKKYEVMTVLGGHYHRNVLFSYEGIPGVINRSTLKNSENVCGYSIYTVSELLHVTEKQPANADIHLLSLPFEKEQIANEENVTTQKETVRKKRCVFRRK